MKALVIYFILTSQKIDLNNPLQELSRPRLAIQLSKERMFKNLFCPVLGKKRTPQREVGAPNLTVTGTILVGKQLHKIVNTANVIFHIPLW